MDGLISRQAAIDALGYCQTYLFDSRDDDKKISLEDAEYAIEQLPSAQLEVVRCKDCDWWSPMLDSLQGRCALHGSYPTGAWFCGNARRKRNDTD